MGRRRKHPPKPPAFQFKINDNVIYIGGLYEEYYNQPCIITNRSKKHKKEYYKIMFNDGNIFETTGNALKRKDGINC